MSAAKPTSVAKLFSQGISCFTTLRGERGVVLLRYMQNADVVPLNIARHNMHSLFLIESWLVCVAQSAHADGVMSKRLQPGFP